MSVNTVQAGDVIGEYVLLEKIGSGGFGEVWRARHYHWTDHLVAIKIPTNPEYLKQLRNEGQIQRQLAEIDSKHIAKTFGLNLLHTPPYFVMEYIDGPSLRDRVASLRKIPLKKALSIADQLLSALRVTHRKGVIHRDIKPSNILFTRSGIAKLTDFGIGLSNREVVTSMLSGSISTDQAKGVAGTYEYMSPEQKKGYPLDASTDLYSLGVVLFEMVTGELPQPGDKPSDIDRSLPVEFDAFIARSVVRKEKRFKNAEVMQEVLRKIPGWEPLKIADDPPAKDVSARNVSAAAGAKPSEKPRKESTSNDFSALGFTKLRSLASHRGDGWSPRDEVSIRREEQRHDPVTPGTPGISPRDAKKILERSKDKTKYVFNLSPSQKRDAFSHPAYANGNGHSNGTAHKNGHTKSRAEVKSDVAKLKEKADALLFSKSTDYKKLSSIGIELYENLEFKDSAKVFSRVLELIPNSATANNNLGLALAKLGKVREAIGYYKQAIEAKPEFASAHNNLGSAYYNLGRLDEAKLEYMAALKLDPNSQAALYNLIVPFGNQMT
ncbi:MAG: protein kinase [Planctomycetes bacterium]|nr:protein kinase [Planctomycetota bacterium]